MTANAHPQSSSSAIRLRLQTSKRAYRISEPLEVMAYLENVSRKHYYVGSTDISLLGGVSLHDMEVEIRDEKGKEVVIGRGGGTWFWKPHTPLKEKLAIAYVHLQPGKIHGLKQKIDYRIEPGRHQLVVTYKEYYASLLTEEERKSLTIPIWTEPLVSNIVFIRVVAAKGKRARGAGRPNKRLNRTRNQQVS